MINNTLTKTERWKSKNRATRKEILCCVGDVGALFVARAVTPPDILIRHPFG